MVPVITDDDNTSIEDRILFAFIEQYNERYPNYGLEPGFVDMLRDFFKMAYDIGATNTLEQAVEFAEQMRSITTKNVSSIRALIDVVDYLMNHKFEYKHKYYGQREARIKARNEADNRKRRDNESSSKPGSKEIHKALGSSEGA